MSFRMKLFAWSLAMAALLAACRQPTTTHPQYRPLIEAVYASGKVLPADDHSVYAQADGVITRQHVTEGDSVRAGQAMFTIENTAQAARLGGAEQVLRQAEQNAGAGSPVVAELRAQVASLRARLRDDSTNNIRYQNLWRQNATTRVAMERAALAYQTSKNDLTAARERLRRTQNQLRLDVVNARTTARINATDAGNTVTRADVDGTVFNIFRKQGEAIRRGEPLATLGRRGAFYLQLWVDEADVARVRVGQEATVKLDLYPDQTFRARIRKIYPALNPENQSVRADAELAVVPARLVANAFVEANVVISRQSRALTVPKALVINDSVTVLGPDQKPRKVRIRKGIETTDFVQVLDEITEASELVTP